MSLVRVLEHDFITVTERAALAASQTMGYGDGEHSYEVAAEAMRSTLDGIDIAGRVVIGESERDEAPILNVGEKVDSAADREGEMAVDIAVLPLDGANLCATGAPGAVTVLAAAERGGLLQPPDAFMEKIVVGPSARGRVHLDAPVPENLRNIAKAFRREVSDLTVGVLERGRHQELIADIRSAGARICLIPEGDLSAGIAAAVRGTGVHAVMGISGAPEGVITAAAMRCLGGEIQARLKAVDEAQEKRLAETGFDDLQKIFGTEDLAPGEKIVFSSTGVTESEFLRGVRFFGGGSRTSTLVMSLTSRIIRFVDTIHRENLARPVHFR
ncbi:MAG: class II fructose-bisphosphatase [bacterium]|nr:class II fructose-bisphosphatase [bacterium]